MRCFYADCNKEGRGYPFQHEWLITPYPIDLCNDHAAELYGYLENRDALALEKFSKSSGFKLYIRDSLVTLMIKKTHRH